LKLSYDKSYFDSIWYNYDEQAYELEIKYPEEDNLQTIWMQFGEVDDDSMNSYSSSWWNVALSIYNKRKDIFSNMDKKLSTGKDLIRNFIIARKMFDALEATVIEHGVNNKQDVVIYCRWEDNRRRDAYYKVLSKKGYRYGVTPWGKKVIMKKFKYKDYED
jgi:hypothetical protein